MAAPIAHIFLALQMLSGPFKGLFNEKEFLVGTSFPDIRYLKVIEREKTHFSRVALTDIIREKDSFRAGVLFHSFVDEKREEYVVKNGFYEKIPDFKFSSQSLKFAEDVILKNHFDITPYIAYFDGILEQETQCNIAAEHIKSWHFFLQEYFRGRYSEKELILKYFDFNEPNSWRIKRWIFSWIYSEKVRRAMFAIIHNQQIHDLVLRFYMNFRNDFLQ